MNDVTIIDQFLNTFAAYIDLNRPGFSGGSNL